MVIKNSKNLDVNIGDELYAIYPLRSTVRVVEAGNDTITVIDINNNEVTYRYTDLGRVMFLCEKDYYEKEKSGQLQDIRYSIFAVSNCESRYQMKKQIEEERSQMSYYDLEFLFESEYFDRVIFEVERNLKISKDYEESQKYNTTRGFDKNWSGYISNSEENDPRHNHALQTRIRQEPYFAKVCSKATGEFYLGKNTIDEYVVDWRDTEKANLYYNYNILVGREEPGIQLIRDFNIQDALVAFDDRYSTIAGKTASIKHIDENVIYDEFLIRILENNRTIKGIHDIIQSIRAEQYEIITQKPEKNILVSGCAGSGKTMIMIHRISYLAYNYKDINDTNVIFVSPNAMLKKEATNLAKEIGLNDYVLKPVSILFADMISDYSLTPEVFSYTNQFVSNWTLPSKVINRIYDSIFIQQFIDAVEKTCNDANHSINFTSKDITPLITFRNLEEIRLAQEFRLLTGIKPNQKNLAEELNSNQNLIAMVTEYEDILSNLSKVNVGARLFGENREQSKANKSLKYLIEHEQNTNKKQQMQNEFNILFHYYESTSLTGEPKYNLGIGKSGDASVRPSIFKKAMDFHNRFSSITNNGKPEELSKQLSRFMRKKKRYDSYLNNGNWENYAFEIILGIIEDIKTQFEVTITATFDFEPFLLLLGLQKLFGYLDSKYRLFVIDEYQDYSIEEISLIRRVYPNSIINLYGDPYQRISIKGSSIDFGKHALGLDTNEYILKENYRNSKEITEFINHQFNMNMTAVGIKGNVDRIQLTDLNKLLTTGTKYAIIIKDIDSIRYIQPYIEQQYLLVNDDSMDINSDKLLIFPVYYVKGLEFENVIVYDGGMSENEKYISYSRALTQLVVIH